MSSISIQQLLQRHLGQFTGRYRLLPYHIKSLEQLRDCRTSQMGSHSQYCTNGHLMGVFHNSCRNRGCPQCQRLKTEQWLQKQQSKLLNTQHHHWIFTLPHQLNKLWLYNREWLNDAFFTSVQSVVKELAADPKYLNARPGFILAFHSWGRSLSFHPHIHCLITHGGLSEQEQWITPKKKVMFPAKVMMKLFKGRLQKNILEALESGKLKTPPETNQAYWIQQCKKQYAPKWVVHACPSYSHGNGVAKYLARYMRGGAIKNGRLFQKPDQSITLHYQSHKTQQREKINYTPEQMIRKIVQHLPLKNKATTRLYGLYNDKCIRLLNTARAYFNQSAVQHFGLDIFEYLKSKEQLPACPHCGAPLASIKKMGVSVH